jgi:hypothetical protein
MWREMRDEYLQCACIGNVDDERIAEGTTLCCKNTFYCSWLEGVGSQSIDGFSGENNEFACT